MSVTPKVAAFTAALMIPGWSLANYPDVPSTHWAHDAVAKTTHAGLMRGRIDGRFHGSKAATRYDLAVALGKLLAEIENSWAAHGQNPEDLVPYIEQINLYVADELDRLKQSQRELRAWIHELKAGHSFCSGHQSATVPGTAETRVARASSTHTLPHLDNHGRRVVAKKAGSREGGGLKGWLSNVLGFEDKSGAKETARSRTTKAMRAPATPSATADWGAPAVGPETKADAKPEVVPGVRVMSGPQVFESRASRDAAELFDNAHAAAGRLDPIAEIVADNTAEVSNSPVFSSPVEEAKAAGPATSGSVGTAEVAPEIGEFVIDGKVLNLSNKSRSILETMRKRRGH